MPVRAEAFFRAGSLEFSAEEKARQAKILSKVSISVVDVYLDRTTVIPEVVSQASAVTVSYGSSDNASLDVILGYDGAKPEGKLPFDLPSSMQAVEQSQEALPSNTANPLFQVGYRLEYST